jgi:[ribosomal protein S5]-alanine N-acetyltransferase
MLIHTERLVLEGINVSMYHELFSTLTESELITYFGIDADTFPFYENMHKKGMETFRISFYSFLLRLKDTNRTIGEIGYHTWNPTHRRAEIYYKINDETMKNKGYIKEALGEVLQYGYEKMNLHRIQALIDDNNIPSKKLLLHYGFQKEGTVREDYVVNGVNEDSYQYSLLKHEFKF